MDIIRIAAATVNQTPLDWEGNFRRIKDLIENAKKSGVGLLSFPELCITGYGCEDAFHNLHTIKKAEELLTKLIEATQGIAVLLGLPVIIENRLYNAAALVQDCRLCGLNIKKILPREGVHYENRWFNPWPFERAVSVTLCGQQVQAGDLYYKFGAIGVGVEICEEAWADEASFVRYADHVEVVLNPSASHFAIGKYDVRQRLVLNRSRANNVHYVYSNLLGLEAGRVIFDGGAMVAEAGTLALAGPRFGFHDGSLTIYDLDMDLARTAKIRSRQIKYSDPPPNSQKSRDAGKEHVVNCSSLQSKPSNLLPQIKSSSQQNLTQFTAEEEFLEAEMLGLFDYLRKTNAKGYTVSLSGGCDSSTIAVLVAHMVASSLKELGPGEFIARLGLQDLCLQNDTLKSCDHPRMWIHEILSCMYQKTNQSSAETEDAARLVAEALGATFYNVNIEPLVNSYKQIVESCVGRKLSWECDDLALQNIQARTRAPFAWFIANLKRSILLCTSNRSEASVGYATMDGDTAGGLAPLAGIDKHFLRGWLLFAETSCKRGLGPTPALRHVNTLQPTAELRPSSMKQTDESDLMPYEILAGIERCFLRYKMPPNDIPSYLEMHHPHFSLEELEQHCKKFFDLWRKSQWKRERCAPGFHLTDESVDPKTWCRFPILSGKFED